MSSPLMLAAEEARRLLQQYGFTDEEAEITVVSETRLSDVIARLVEADAADEAAIAQCSARAQELRLRAERLKARQERRRDAIVNALETAGLPRLPCGTATVSLTTTRPGVVISDSESLPEDCLKTVTAQTPDKAAIRAKLEAGEAVPGAMLSNARRSVMIKRT